MKILEPVRIGTMDVKNRFVVTAMLSEFCREDGNATEKLIAYHEAKAKGGFGLIITEDYVIDKNVGATRNIPGLWSDGQIPSHAELTKRVHAAGAKIVCQIYHAGRETVEQIMGGPLEAPSAIKDPVIGQIPVAMSVEQIQKRVEQFGDCALRAKKAGFDGVEIHGAHGYLVGEFLSPVSNIRTDAYGGSVYNRTRFAVEIVRNIREKCGEDFPILFRFSVQEYVEGGLTLNDSRVIAQILEKAGVDAFNCSQGVYGSMHTIIPPTGVPAAAYIENAAAIKEVVSVPVIGVGRIKDPFVAESLLQAGKCDLCAMSRASIADPEMPKKFMEGRYDEIRYCIGCVQGCSAKPCGFLRCLVNPMTGMEDTYPFQPVEAGKRLVVIGGGIAGCEAAIVAAQRGYTVTLLEQSDHLGGQWNLAAIPTGKQELTTFTIWQKNKLEQLGVDVRLNTTADKTLIDGLQPDAIIAATGSHPLILRIPGAEQHTITAHDILSGRVNPGHKAVIIGGGMVGAETAEFMAAAGHEVTILEMRGAIAKDCQPSVRYYLMQRLENHHVQCLTGAKVSSLGENSVSYEQDGKLLTLDGIDTIIWAVGVRSEHTLADELQESGYTVKAVGDALRAGDGYKAILEGFEAGLSI